ncbi:RusA family crossover junction endodeoxyribonuclease [Acrocarpospora sp. B8E8]|uniref:RusA family crossover junction endodeoxyribonuclease n=1 Tax=Acrocarpospora sp. B8E8 TaxID=3153572 RepID=UPI00325E2DB9
MTDLDLIAASAASPAGAAPHLTITVHGDPEPQGAISYSKHGRGYYSNDPTLKVWREAVRNAAMVRLGTHQHVPGLGEKKKSAGPCLVCDRKKKDHGLLTGALRAEFIVSLVRPKSVPVTRDPITRSSGDWDHHGRSIGDALTQASVMCDDSQIVDGRVAKYYAGSGRPLVLDRPGAVIRIWALDPQAVV